jgi:diaminopimelate decarboxylase
MIPASRLPDDGVAEVFRTALRTGGVVGDDDTAILFHDLTHVASRVASLQAAFPATTLHAIAVKANPLLKILEQLVALDVGLEVASLPELALAERAGAPARRIVFDSPAKTLPELRRALDFGCHVNADSLDELARIARLFDEGIATTSTFGVRVNPQIGTGSIASTSVAGQYSKFGVALDEQRAAIIHRFVECDWLEGLHLHIGSQGCPMEMLLQGIERVLDLADDIDAALVANGQRKRVRFFDIGGGLPVSYHPDVEPPSIRSYAEAIGKRFGDLVSGRFELMTEFGRYVHANSGWVASRVEYVKKNEGRNTAIIHVGADLLLRKCYRPSDWHHEIMVLDSAGNRKTGADATPWTIAGPLCFAGDMIAQDIALPIVEEGDWIVVRDTGAYTLSMWSRYNSRQVPKVIGYVNDGERFEVLRERETVEQVLSFWA